MALLLIQSFLQIAGILELYEQIMTKSLIRKGLSSKTILLAMCWDISELIVLAEISYISQVTYICNDR